MKKTAALLLGLLLCLTAMTAAGDSDPLISQSYLEGEFLQSLEEAVGLQLDASDEAIRAGAGQKPPAAPEGEGDGPREHMLKKGDVLSGGTGASVTLLGGEVRLGASSGTVVDVTEGTEVLAGQPLRINHRYIVPEDADFTVSSPAAVLSSQGGGRLTASQSPDHFAAARALRALGLFRGAGSGFGEGFDLHLAPERGEGLVMFLRLLGEGEQALAWTGSHPFTDVPRWLDRYVAWAYAKGYSNGVAADRFGARQSMSAVEYTAFLLRALGYGAAGEDDYAASLERAAECGLLSERGYALLREEDFLRAHVAGVSYAALEVPGRNGETLARRLKAAGVVTEEQLAQARTLANSFQL